MFERLKQIRQAQNLNQADFAKSLGMGQSTLAMLEVGKREILDRHIKTICSVYNINEHWLRTGEGKMFQQSETFSLDEEAKKSNLSELEIVIMRSYMSLDRATRDKLMDEIETHFKKKYGIETAATTETITSVDPTPEQIAQEEAEKYRLEVLAELKGETSSASEKPGEKLG